MGILIFFLHFGHGNKKYWIYTSRKCIGYIIGPGDHTHIIKVEP